MSEGIRTSEITGDVSIGRNTTVGGSARVRCSARVGGNLKVDGWLDARNVKGPSKGLYATEADLKGSYPRPLNGWWAIVGDGLPGALWRAFGGVWIDTGGTAGGVVSIDSDRYLQEADELGGRMSEIEAELSEHDGRISAAQADATRALSAASGAMEQARAYRALTSDEIDAVTR